MTQQSLSRILTRQSTSKRKAAENLHVERGACYSAHLLQLSGPDRAPAASLRRNEEETLWYCLKSDFGTEQPMVDLIQAQMASDVRDVSTASFAFSDNTFPSARVVALSSGWGS